MLIKLDDGKYALVMDRETLFYLTYLFGKQCSERRFAGGYFSKMFNKIVTDEFPKWDSELNAFYSRQERNNPYPRGNPVGHFLSYGYSLDYDALSEAYDAL